MKTSYNEACARDCSTLEKDLALCEKAGFDYIEIRLDLLRGWLKEHTVEQLKDFFRNASAQAPRHQRRLPASGDAAGRNARLG